jgi:hypothetical protein
MDGKEPKIQAMTDAENHQRTVQRYSDRTIMLAIVQLRSQPVASREGTWENLRLAALREEMRKREQQIETEQ